MESNTYAEQEQEQDNSEACLLIIQKLYQDNQINDDQRDDLKDMVFDDDAKLFGLFARYAEEEEELKNQIVAYIRSEAPDSPDPTAKASELDELSSPADAAIDVKKRRRMQKLQEAKLAMQAEKEKLEKEAAVEKEHSAFSLAECDIGASPKLNPVNSKKGRLSPIVRAKQFNLNSKS